MEYVHEMALTRSSASRTLRSDSDRWPVLCDASESCEEGKSESEERRPPQFAILHTSEQTIRLLAGPLEEPSVTHNLARQAHMLATRFDRLNMLASIPELGVVVVAGQGGRAAIVSLRTRRPSGQYGFRIEAILPTFAEEEQTLRPGRPLLGIAVGPIQGREKAHHGMDLGDGPGRQSLREAWRTFEARRRYRLMLTYSDSTVLSYEIGRQSGAETQANLLLT